MGTLRVDTLSTTDDAATIGTSDVAYGTASAWVNWQANGTINASFNVSTVSDVGVGSYVISFANDLPSGYYGIGTFSYDPSMGNGNDLYQLMGFGSYPPTTYNCGVYSKKDDGGVVDVEQNMMSFFANGS